MDQNGQTLNKNCVPWFGWLGLVGLFGLVGMSGSGWFVRLGLVGLTCSGGLGFLGLRGLVSPGVSIAMLVSLHFGFDLYNIGTLLLVAAIVATAPIVPVVPKGSQEAPMHFVVKSPSEDSGAGSTGFDWALIAAIFASICD